jgi:superfamily II DNA or RNA helicase
VEGGPPEQTTPEATPGGVALIERVLDVGYPLTQFTGVSETGFSERNRLIEEAESIVRARFQEYADIADTLNIEVPDFVDWEVPPQEMTELRALVREQKIRTQMLDGMAEFVNDEARMSRLRPEQRDAMRATRHFMEFASRMPKEGPAGRTVGYGKSGYIDMPTGTGKTGTFISIAQALKLKESPDDPIKVLFLTPTRNIQIQTIGDKTVKPKDRNGFAKFWPEADPTEWSGDVKQISDKTIMTNASFNQLVQSGRMDPSSELFEEQFNFDVIIIDESHTDLGENIMDSIRRYYPNKLTIALSATPDYHEEKRTAYLMQHEIFRLPLVEAIEGGALAPASAEHRQQEPVIDEDELPENPIARRRYIDEAYFYARLNRSMPDIVRAVIKGDGVLVRCPPGKNPETGEDIWFARRAAELIREQAVTLLDRSYRGRIKAVAVGGEKQKARDLPIILGGFNNRKVHVICFVDAVNMGTDVPPAKEGHDLSPTESRVKVVQFFGRFLRLIFDKNGAPIPAKVVTYDDPRMPNQYTSVHALEMREGHASVGFKQSYREKYTHVTYDYDSYQNLKPKIRSEGVIGAMSVEHSRVVTAPAESDALSFEDVCFEFGIERPMLRQYLQDVGYEGEPDLPEDEYYALVELIMEGLPDPGAAASQSEQQPAAPEKPRSRKRRFPYAPAEGYTDIDSFMGTHGWDDQRELVDQLRRAHVPIHLFRDRRDNKIKYFIPDTF